MNSSQRLESQSIYLQPMTLEEYLEARQYIHGPEYLKYDSPDRPVPTIEDDHEFWVNYLIPGHYLTMAIRRKIDDALSGFVSAFDFNDVDHSCESGINVFPPENFGKGYGSEAYRLFIPWVHKVRGIRRMMILTHPENIRAQRMYEKLGFEHAGRIPDTCVTWVKMILEIL